MALDNAKNFAKSTLAAGIAAGATSLSVATGDGTRFPTVSFNATIWNQSNYPDPSDDPNREIVRVTNISGDTFTITRAQESTSDVAHNTSGKVYGILAGLTAKTINTDIPATYAPITSPTFLTSITGSYLTASEILITDGSKNIVSAAVATYPSLTELTYLKGATSAIQTQLNAKQATLVSGTNIKTVNGSTLLGSGDLVVSTSISGTDTQLLFFDGNNNPAGDSGFTYNKTTDFATLVGGLVAPKIIGSTSTTGDLSLQTTSGVGVAGADMHFLVGNNGATEAMTILNSGKVGVGISPVTPLTVSGALGVLNLITGVGMLDEYGVDYATSFFQSDTGTNWGIFYSAVGNSPFGMWQEFWKSRSTNGTTHAAVGSTDEISRFRFSGDTGSQMSQGAEMAVSVDGTVSSTRVPMKIDFYTRATGGALTKRLSILGNGNINVGNFSPTALLHLGPGTATASTAPLKFTSGTLLSTAEAGAVEFLTDDFFATITTGAARKGIVLDDGTRLTSGRVPFATTNGRLIDDADFTFATDTLTATKIVGTTSIKVGTAAGYISSDGSTGATGSFTTADAKTVTVKDGIITAIV